MADRRSPEYHLKTVLLAVIFVLALAAGVAILSFGLTRMFGIRKRPERTASLSVRLPPRYEEQTLFLVSGEISSSELLPLRYIDNLIRVGVTFILMKFWTV